MKNISHLYVFSVKMGNYLILSDELRDLALNALKLESYDNKYLSLSTQQIKQISFTLLKHLSRQINKIAKTDTPQVEKNSVFLAFLGEREVAFNKADKKQRELFNINASYYFLNEAMPFNDLTVYFADEMEEECPEVRQIMMKPRVLLLNFPQINSSLLSFMPNSNVREELKLYNKTYFLLGFIGENQDLKVLLDSQYHHVYLKDKNEPIFVNNSPSSFIETLKKIDATSKAIQRQTNDFLKQLEKLAKLKKEIWLIDKTISLKVSISLWREIFFPKIDELYDNLLEKYLNDRKEKQKKNIHFSPRLSEAIIFH